MSEQAYVEQLMHFGYRPRFLADGTPCAVVEQGRGPHRTFVTSIPKSGTYLIAEVLSEFGIRDSQMNVEFGQVSDYRAYRADTPMLNYQFPIPTGLTLRLVLPGQFAVGHLPATEECKRPLAGFRTIFMFRELRRVLVSWGRFVMAERMYDGTDQALEQFSDGPDRIWWVLNHPSSFWLMLLFNEMVGWRDAPGTLSVAFEDLVGHNGAGLQAETAARLARHLELAISDDEAARIARDCVGRKTFTSTGAHSELATHWDARLEDWFQKAGGPALNQALGYAEAD
jgi:hypothetical protein